MSAAPRVSVVIPTFNGWELLEACLGSLETQSLRPHEVIIVDDHSTERAPPALLRTRDDVHLIRRRTNGGYGAAVNDGILASEGDLVAILNDDAECAPNCLEQWVEGLNAVPPVDIAAPKILFAERRDVINSAGLAPGPNGRNHDRGYGLPDGPEWDVPRLVFGACGAALLARRRLFDAVGLFEQRMFMYYEDVEWAFRARALGFQCRYVPRARVYHHEGASRGALPRSALYYQTRNLHWVVAMHYSWPLLVRFGPRVGWGTLRQLAGDVTRGSFDSWRGLFAACGDARRVLRKRRLLRLASEDVDVDMAGWLRANAAETANVHRGWRAAGDPA